MGEEVPGLSTWPSPAAKKPRKKNPEVMFDSGGLVGVIIVEP